MHALALFVGVGVACWLVIQVVVGFISEVGRGYAYATLYFLDREHLNKVWTDI